MKSPWIQTCYFTDCVLVPTEWGVHKEPLLLSSWTNWKKKQTQNHGGDIANSGNLSHVFSSLSGFISMSAQRTLPVIFHEQDCWGMQTFELRFCLWTFLDSQICALTLLMLSYLFHYEYDELKYHGRYLIRSKYNDMTCKRAPTWSLLMRRI